MGLIPGSFMTGDRAWLIIGLIVVFVGVALILFGTSRRKPSA
jgi:cbb3-type cytochrome oxidase subunit 3